MSERDVFRQFVAKIVLSDQFLYSKVHSAIS